MASSGLLKRDALGTIALAPVNGGQAVVRDPSAAPRLLRPFAHLLANREAAALARLAGHPAVPRLLGRDGPRVVRSWLAGQPLHRAASPGADYFRNARRALRQLHRAGITHNDLAKEANWLCLGDDRCGIVDFQLAVYFRQRGRWFRLLAREDLRHLLKHKRHYLPGALTARERAILAQPAWPARLWRHAGKPVYRFVTRRLLGWHERHDAEERGAVAETD